MTFPIRVNCFLLSLAFAGTTSGQEAPKALPAEVQAAWEKTGAVIGRMDPQDIAMFRAGEDPDKPGQVPALLLGNSIEGLLTKPMPQTAFGLELSVRMPNDTALKELAKLKHLRLLFVTFYYDTTAKPNGLAGLKQLERLDLNGVVVTDAVLKELAELKQLKGLSIFQSTVTDAGIDDVTRLQKLQMLNLRGTKATYAGLKKLARLNQLQKLYLGNNQVTDAELEGLQKALPRVEITRY